APQVQAQQQERAPWQTETNSAASQSPPVAAPLTVPSPVAAPPIVSVPPNTTVVPRSAPETRPAPGAAIAGQVSLVALLTQDGQNIEQGLVWRGFRGKPGPDGKTRLGCTPPQARPTP